MFTIVNKKITVVDPSGNSTEIPYSNFISRCVMDSGHNGKLLPSALKERIKLSDKIDEQADSDKIVLDRDDYKIVKALSEKYEWPASRSMIPIINAIEDAEEVGDGNG